MKYLFVVAAIIITGTACKPKKQQETNMAKKQIAMQPNDPEPGASIASIDSSLAQADSMVFVFYNDPHGKDSLRYSRFYKEVHSTDAAMLKLVKQHLGLATERMEKVKPCRNEGKIWCFAGGEILQTIYFSASPQGCTYIYIIRNGQFYYSPLPLALAAALAEMKPKASAPAS